MEELSFAQLQLEETTENNKEVDARLRNQLKESEEELFALQFIKKKDQTPRSEPDTPVQPSNDKHAFRETVKGIRDYLDSLEARKL